MISRYASLKQGLVGCWCPSVSGSFGFRLPDLSQYGNHGTLTNMDPGADWVPSGGKLALDFDGFDDYVLASPLSVFVGNASNFTFSLWHNPANINTTIDLVAQHQVTGSTIGRQNASVRFRNGGQTLLSNASLATGTWIHIAGLRIGSTAQLWINGVFDNSGVPGTVNSTNGLFIGGNSSGQYGAGQIDDVRIYNRALTPSEIRLLYTGGRGVGLIPERIKHRRKTTAAASNRRRRLICGANC